MEARPRTRRQSGEIKSRMIFIEQSSPKKIFIEHKPTGRLRGIDRAETKKQTNIRSKSIGPLHFAPGARTERSETISTLEEQAIQIKKMIILFGRVRASRRRRASEFWVSVKNERRLIKKIVEKIADKDTRDRSAPSSAGWLARRGCRVARRRELRRSSAANR